MAQSIGNGTAVAAHNIAVEIQIIAGRIILAGVFFHEADVIPVRNEADILAVPLAGINKILRLGNLPYLLLGQFSQRESGMHELMLIQAGQEISLILGRVGSLLQQISAGRLVLADPGVMAGDHPIKTQFQRFIHKDTEFHIAIAFHAGVGGQTGFVGADKTVDHVGSEIFPGVKDMKIHIQTLGNGLGISDTVATGIPHPQVGTGAGNALLQHQPGCYRTVHTATHGDQSFVFCHGHHLPFVWFIVSCARRKSNDFTVKEAGR